MIKATIYTVLAICFLALTLLMVINGFELRGFNAALLVTIAGIMTLIMFLASWTLWKNAIYSIESKAANKTKSFGVVRVGKVLLASYGVALAAAIFSIVSGMWLFGFEKMDMFIDQYMVLALIVTTIICAPIVNRYLL